MSVSHVNMSAEHRHGFTGGGASELQFNSKKYNSGKKIERGTADRGSGGAGRKRTSQELKMERGGAAEVGEGPGGGVGADCIYPVSPFTKESQNEGEVGRVRHCSKIFPAVT